MSFVAKGTCFTVSVREFLDNIYSKAGLKQGSAAELKSLCLGLFEALNDKSIALQHQRKTNQYVCLFFSCPMLWIVLLFSNIVLVEWHITNCYLNYISTVHR